MKNIILPACITIAFLFARCNSNANGKVNSKSDTSVDTIGKHAPYGKDTLDKKRMDSVINKNDSLH